MAVQNAGNIAKCGAAIGEAGALLARTLTSDGTGILNHDHVHRAVRGASRNTV